VTQGAPERTVPFVDEQRSARPYAVGSVVSRDGTAIAYRQYGDGPGIIAVHGGAQAAQNFTKLATALSDAFTVYVPDRRGRGRSGPPGDDYGLQAECEDLDALLTATRSHNVFGLSSGALISLQAALTLPAIRKVALYEPPLSINHSTPIDWAKRYEREVAAGKLGSAMITVIRGTQTAPPLFRLAPRFILDPLLNAATRIDVEKRRSARPVDPSSARGRVLRVLLWPVRSMNKRNEQAYDSAAARDDVPLKALVPTMHYDAQLVIESEGSLASFRDVRAEVLLLGGAQSPAYLKKSLLGLERVLPNVSRRTFPGVGHLAADNSGKPEMVAAELRRFFSDQQ
jgi:pimeloyl-ACP methyl ester carboxylesterase